MTTLWLRLFAAILPPFFLFGCVSGADDMPSRTGASRLASAQGCQPCEAVPRKGEKSKAATAGKEKKAEPGKEKSASLGACAAYQLMGGAVCEELSKQSCYEKHMNVVDWREGASCSGGSLSSRAESAR